MRVRWLRRAILNLEEAAAFIAEDDPGAAIRFIDRIEEAVARLASFPALGRPGRLAGTRELVISGTAYIVPYRVTGDEIQIIRLFHGARRWPPLH